MVCPLLVDSSVKPSQRTLPSARSIVRTFSRFVEFGTKRREKRSRERWPSGGKNFERRWILRLRRPVYKALVSKIPIYLFNLLLSRSTSHTENASIVGFRLNRGFTKWRARHLGDGGREQGTEENFSSKRTLIIGSFLRNDASTVRVYLSRFLLNTRFVSIVQMIVAGNYKNTLHLQHITR